eukprot:scaffold21267_cov110-Skeletonema_marinoi.AAC.2
MSIIVYTPWLDTFLSFWLVLSMLRECSIGGLDSPQGLCRRHGHDVVVCAIDFGVKEVEVG